jgi:hypothetical protein
VVAHRGRTFKLAVHLDEGSERSGMRHVADTFRS